MNVDELVDCAAKWTTPMVAWAAERLARDGLTVTGPPQPRLRPWSITMRLPTSGGPVWFKANSPAAAYEPRLVLALGAARPGSVLTPLAVDEQRAWWLQPDAGTSLRTLMAGVTGPGDWIPPLQAYAALQRATSGCVDELLALGAPDLRPGALPGHLDALLAAEQVTAQVDAPEGLPAERYAALLELRPTFARWCAELSAAGVPPAVEHADLHDGQVYAAGDAPGGWRFIDWGDAAVGHPFASLAVVLERAAQRFGLAPDDPGLARLRDAYLEAWTGEQDAASLRAAASLAMRLSVIARALAWRRVFPMAEEACFDRHGRDVVALLARLLA